MKSNEVRGPARMMDVAKAAGVSLSTASLILSDKGDRYSAKTRQKVMDTAERLGWRPNALITGFQSGKSRMIGVLVPPYDSYYIKVLVGIHQELAARDYVPITLWVGQSEENYFHSADATDDGLQQIYRLVDRRVEGFVLWPVIAGTYTQHFSEWLERDIPVVVIDDELPGGLADSVETDEVQGGRLVAEHLSSLGHRRVAILSRATGNPNDWSRQRTDAAVAALKERGVEVQVWRPQDHAEDVLSASAEMLEAEFAPTAVFCITDAMATVFYSAARERGVSIPHDISVLGYADLEQADGLHPALSTIRQQPLEIGRAAARLLLDRIEGRVKASPQRSRFGCELVVRGSTAEV